MAPRARDLSCLWRPFRRQAVESEFFCCIKRKTRFHGGCWRFQQMMKHLWCGCLAVIGIPSWHSLFMWYLTMSIFQIQLSYSFRFQQRFRVAILWTINFPSQAFLLLTLVVFAGNGCHRSSEIQGNATCWLLAVLTKAWTSFHSFSSFQRSPLRGCCESPTASAVNAGITGQVLFLAVWSFALLIRLQILPLILLDSRLVNLKSHSLELKSVM